ncbi:alpha/beta hydrolase family protein [Kitasatospora sp. NPDC127111]|uniref:alpha/beta hydrolase family protein n=1 Tax=Kitasatospora sp. NPDC127111 TaxID=3345363 RepID=UPI00362AC759
MTHRLPIGRRAVTRSAVLGSAALLLGVAGRARADSVPTPPASAAPAPSAPGEVVPTLPAPTGPHAVGAHPVHLVDASRRDPWLPAIPVRELMLTVFYPARDITGCSPLPQLPPLAARLFGQIAPRSRPQLPAAGVDWAATRSHSFSGAAPLPGRRPVLLHSPGGGDPRGLGTLLAEELASHGAVVVSVDHPGDAAGVEFPDVTDDRREPVRATELRRDPRDEPSVFRRMIDARVADLRFVLERLGRAAELPLPDGLADVLDLRRVGVYGHSAGGSAVTEALHEDRRVRAGINLEGFLDHPPAVPGGAAEPFAVTANGVDRPLLLLGSERFDRRAELERSWSALAARSGRWVHRRCVADAGHWTFTDFAAVLPQLRAAGLMTAAGQEALIGTADPAVALPEIHRTVRGFFARHLR